MQAYSSEKVKGGMITRKIRYEFHLTALLLKSPRAQRMEVMLWSQYLPPNPSCCSIINYHRGGMSDFNCPLQFSLKNLECSAC